MKNMDISSHAIWEKKQVPHTESAVFFEENILVQIGIGNRVKCYIEY
jgi:hypothetical protein